MTGIEAFNFPAFREAAARLHAAGYDVEDPSEKGVIDGWTWADYLKYDLRKVLDCQGVATLSGWENSKGAKLEVHVATELGLIVRSVDAFISGSRMSGTCQNCLDQANVLKRVAGYMVCPVCEIESALPANMRRGASF